MLRPPDDLSAAAAEPGSGAKLAPYLDAQAGRHLFAVAGDAVAFDLNPALEVADGGGAAGRGPADDTAAAGALEAAPPASAASDPEARRRTAAPPRVAVLGDPSLPAALAAALQQLGLGARARLEAAPEELGAAGAPLPLGGDLGGSGGHLDQLPPGAAAATAAAPRAAGARAAAASTAAVLGRAAARAGDAAAAAATAAGADAPHAHGSGGGADNEAASRPRQWDLEVLAVIPGRGRLAGRPVLSEAARARRGAAGAGAAGGGLDLGGLAATRAALRPRRRHRRWRRLLERHVSFNYAAPWRCLKGALRCFGLRGRGGGGGGGGGGDPAAGGGVG